MSWDILEIYHQEWDVMGVLIRDGGLITPKNPPRMGCVFLRIIYGFCSSKNGDGF